MGGIAFVFSGQGDQYPGMGMELCSDHKSAAKVFAMCDAIRPGTANQCFYGSDKELSKTVNTQPCLYAMELAAAAVLMDKGIRPGAVAGFSMGELTAAAIAGVFDWETGFRLICRRGALMHGEAVKHNTAMAAIVRLTPEKVTELCKKHDRLYPVNFNCPGQITVSGMLTEFPAFFEEVREAGGRGILLKVRGAFHSPFMEPAATAFAKELEKAKLREPKLPIYSNVTAEPYGDAMELLPKQIKSPVLWEKTVRNMIASGIDTFIEVGPGRTLTNMIRKTDPQVKTYSVSELDSLFSEVLA
jgi:[acyl-carrier-protein] S-malonyltransferase